MNELIRIILTVCGYLLLSVQTVYASSGSNPTIVDQYVALALQGDLSEAESILAEIDPENPAFSEIGLADHFRIRFIEQDENPTSQSGDAQVDAIVAAYRRYWTQVLIGTTSPEHGEKQLRAELGRLLEGPSDHPDRPVYEQLNFVLGEKNIYRFNAPAPPLQELILWKRQKNRTYRVRLTDRTQEVQVRFMQDIISSGWKDYATLGLVATTGWVEDGRLYCVEDLYDRTSERFEVSFLKHESRHLADLERFPSLSSADLEYRAKLTELAFATTTQLQLLIDFTNKSARNADSPHAWANYRVTRDLYRELHGQAFPDSADPWKGVAGQPVRSAAAQLLERNTGELLDGQ